MSLLGPDGRPVGSKGGISIPMRPPNILDVLRAQQGFAQGLAMHEAKLTELHVALSLLIDKGVITKEELETHYKRLVKETEEQQNASNREKEKGQVSPSGEGDEQDSEA